MKPNGKLPLCVCLCLYPLSVYMCMSMRSSVTHYLEDVKIVGKAPVLPNAIYLQQNPGDLCFFPDKLSNSKN